MNTLPLAKERRNANVFAGVGCAMAITGLVLCVWAAAAPLPTEDPASSQPKQLAPLPGVGRDVSPLLARSGATRLVVPSQVQAAVKDTGAAQKLLARVKLQGVVNLGGELVAYVAVEKEGIKTVKKGNTLLSFNVDDVQPGRVVLSLEGVTLELRQ
jgi:hypothetical protein